MNNEKLRAALPKNAGGDAKQAIKFAWPKRNFPNYDDADEHTQNKLSAPLPIIQ